MAATVPKGDRLPPDWNYSVTRDGRVFFVNERSQSTTWLHPLTGCPVQTGNSPTQDLPPGWELAVTLDGTIYFIDHNTHTTAFDHPLSGAPSIYDPSASSPPTSPQSPLSPTIGSAKKPLPKQRNIKAPSAKRNPTSTVMRRGWLYRWEHAAIGKSWKKRWCVLADFALFVYKDEGEINAVASVLLPSYRINLISHSDQVYKDYGFKLEHENTKTLYFATDNQGDLDRWMSLLTQAAMMKGQQGFVRETNNNRYGPRQRTLSNEEDEVDYLQHSELHRSWKDPGSYRKMHREEDMEPPDPREFQDGYPRDGYHDNGGFSPHSNHPPDNRGHPPPSNRSSHAGSATGDPRYPRGQLSPAESYDQEQLKDRWGDIYQGDRNSMARESDRNSMSRPYERDSMSRPQDRDSMSRPHERNSMSRPNDRDSMSRRNDRDSMSRPHDRDSYARHSDRSNMSNPYDRDSMSRPYERDHQNSMSRPNDRDSMSRSHDRDSMSRPYERDSMSRPYDRDSYVRRSDRSPNDRNSMSTISRHSIDPRSDPSRSSLDRRSDPHRHTESMGSLNRAEVRDPHIEGEDPYARIRDIARHESQGFDPSHHGRDNPMSDDPGHQRYGSDGQHSFNQGYHGDQGHHPADERNFQGTPDNRKEDPYRRDENYPSHQRQHSNQHNGSFQPGHAREDSGYDMRDSYGSPQENRDRMSRASDYSGYREGPPDDYREQRHYQDPRGDRSSRTSDMYPGEQNGDYGRHGDYPVQQDGRHGDLPPNFDGRHGDRSSRTSAQFGFDGQRGDRGSRASGQYPASHPSAPPYNDHPGDPYNSPPDSGDRRHPPLTVNIPPTYVNVSADGSAQGPPDSPGRPPYPSQMRQEIARDLAQSKTPQTSKDYMVSSENEMRRMQQSPYFQYPSPRDGQQAGARQGNQDNRNNRQDAPSNNRQDDSQSRREGQGRFPNNGAQEMRSAYERVQQLRQSQRDLRALKSLDGAPQKEAEMKTAEVNTEKMSAEEPNSPSEALYSPGGSYVKNLEQPEDIYERGSAFRPPSSCTSSVKGDNSTLERKSKDDLSESGSRSKLNNSNEVKDAGKEAEDHDGNYIQMTRAIAREIGKSYIQDKWTGPKEDTYARPQRKNKVTRAMSTVKEDPNMSDREVLTTREIKNLNKKYPLNGGRVRMSISAGDLIGKTHDELVLLLIQLRRTQSALEKVKEFYRQRLSERRTSEREYKKQRSDSVGRLDRELEQDHQVYQDYKTQLEEIENKLEVYKPLINLVDNMVTMGSLYGGDNYMLATQYRKHLLRPDQYTEPRDMLNFSRQHQEQKFVQEIEDEIRHLSAEEVDLEEKLERLYELDRNLQEQSFKVVSFREDKELLEKALQGIIRQQDISRNNPRDMSKLVHQQMSIEKELSLVMQQLAEASQQLEETTAENNKIEHEVALLRTKVNGELSRSRSAVSLGDGDKTKQQMEKELAKVNNIMAGLSAERGRLSQAMSTLRRSSSGTQLAPLEKEQEPAKKKSSTYMVTDLDSMETVNVGTITTPKSPYLAAPRSKSMGDLRISPASPISPNQGRQPRIPDRDMMVQSYAEGLNQPIIRQPVISHQRQESSLATSMDMTDNEGDPNSTWDISDADENTKRFFGIIPRERPKLLTVRDVKRQSTQRKEREKMKREPDDAGSSGWYSVSSSQQLPTDSESELPAHGRYPSDISSSFASEISPYTHSNDPGPLYENLPRADHLERTSSVPVLASFSPNPSSRRSSIGLLAPKPFIPYQEKTNTSTAPSGIYTARPFHSEMNLSSEHHPRDSPQEVVQTPNSAFSTPVVFQPMNFAPSNASRVYAPRPWAVDNTGGLLEVKKSPKGRYMTISSSEPYTRETTALLGNTLSSTSAGDLIMNRTIDNVPDIVKSSTQKVDNDPFDEYTIEREILFRPDKVLIPERYQPDSDEEDLTDAQRMQRIEKAEKIKQILANQSVHSLSQPDISRIGGENVHRRVEIEKQRRSHLLALNQDLAKQVTLKTKQDAAKRRKTWSGGQFAEAFPHGVEAGVQQTTSPYVKHQQQRSNILV